MRRPGPRTSANHNSSRKQTKETMKIWITNATSISGKTARSRAMKEYLRQAIDKGKPQVVIVCETNHFYKKDSDGPYKIYQTDPAADQGVQVWIHEDLRPEKLWTEAKNVVAVRLAGASTTIMGIYCPYRMNIQMITRNINQITQNNDNWIIAGDVEQFEKILGPKDGNKMAEAAEVQKKEGRNGHGGDRSHNDIIRAQKTGRNETEWLMGDHYITETNIKLRWQEARYPKMRSRTKTEKYMTQHQELIARTWPERHPAEVVPMDKVDQRHRARMCLNGITEDDRKPDNIEKWDILIRMKRMQQMRSMANAGAKDQWRLIQWSAEGAKERSLGQRPKNTGRNNNRTRPDEPDATRRIQPDLPRRTIQGREGGAIPRARGDIETTIWHVITNLRNSRAMGVDGMPLKELKGENIRKATTADIINRIRRAT